MKKALVWVVLAAAGAGAQTPIQTPTRAPDPDRFKPTTKPVIHDPSTVVEWKGVYYVFGTGRGMTVYSSPDSLTWTRQASVFETIPESVHGVVPLNDGRDVWAPDIVRVGGQFYLYYAVSKWDSFVSAIGLVTNPTLDPQDPTYKWTDHGVVVRSDGADGMNAIDPGVVMGPDGRMWLSYGSYHGTIDVVELNPKTGLRIAPDSPVWVIGSRSEASDLIYRGGYYYLFVNHGTCCQGAKSTYHILMGRSKNATGPYLDRDGKDLAAGGGTLFLKSDEQRIGPGHFGRLLAADGSERFSLHYEADLNNRGRPTLDLRPLTWSGDGSGQSHFKIVPGVW